MATRQSIPRGPVEIAVRVADPAWRQSLPSVVMRARRAARAALAAALPDRLRRHSLELALVLADDAEMRRLNRRYRGIDRPTNVLSFGGSEDWRYAAPGAPVGLGDVVLARETVTAEAAAQGKTITDHVSHLIVHGVLHLLGHDHERRVDASRMECLEIAVLTGLGIADPYVAPSASAGRAAGAKGVPKGVR